jgi:hypothetical protein
MQCGPNGCFPATGYSNANYGATTSVVPSLNLDQVSSWNNNYGNYAAPAVNMNSGFNGATNFGQIAPNRNFGHRNFPGVNTGIVPPSFNTNIANDPMIHLN